MFMPNELCEEESKFIQIYNEQIFSLLKNTYLKEMTTVFSDEIKTNSNCFVIRFF